MSFLDVQRYSAVAITSQNETNTFIHFTFALPSKIETGL